MGLGGSEGGWQGRREAGRKISTRREGGKDWDERYWDGEREEGSQSMEGDRWMDGGREGGRSGREGGGGRDSEGRREEELGGRRDTEGGWEGEREMYWIARVGMKGGSNRQLSDGSWEGWREEGVRTRGREGSSAGEH